MILSGLAFTIYSAGPEECQFRANYSLLRRQGLQGYLPQCPELGVIPFWLGGKHPVPALGPHLSCVGRFTTESLRGDPLQISGIVCAALFSLVLGPVTSKLLGFLRYSALSLQFGESFPPPNPHSQPGLCFTSLPMI